MTTNLHATNIFNVEASLNSWLRSQIATITLPSYLTTIPVITHWPEIEDNLPCISIAHLPGYRRGNYQRGAVKDVLARGQMDVSMWVSRSQLVSGQEVWLARLRYMEGMIEQIHAGAVAVDVKDYLTTPASPTETDYRIVLGDLSMVQVGVDPNPDIERRRALINYRWFLRSG